MGYAQRERQQARREANLPERKPYIVVKEVGQEQFEKVVEAHMGAGYLPIGGVTLFVAPSLIAGRAPSIGYVQSMVVFEAPHAPGS